MKFGAGEVVRNVFYLTLHGGVIKFHSALTIFNLLSDLGDIPYKISEHTAAENL